MSACISSRRTATPPLAFSPDGRFLAAGVGQLGNVPVSGYQTYVWDHSTRQLTAPPVKHTMPVLSLGFSPDNRTLASGDYNGEITFWDIATGQRLGPPLSSGAGPVFSLQFSPGSDVLASNNGDETVVVWDVSLQGWLGTACRVANRNLTRAEWNQFIGPEVDYKKTCAALPPPEGAPAAAG